jgi:hypothetical protein
MAASRVAASGDKVLMLTWVPPRSEARMPWGPAHTAVMATSSVSMETTTPSFVATSTGCAATRAPAAASASHADAVRL